MDLSDLGKLSLVSTSASWALFGTKTGWTMICVLWLAYRTPTSMSLIATILNLSATNFSFTRRSAPLFQLKYDMITTTMLLSGMLCPYHPLFLMMTKPSSLEYSIHGKRLHIPLPRLPQSWIYANALCQGRIKNPKYWIDRDSCLSW